MGNASKQNDLSNGGKRLFDDFDETVSLEHLRLLQSPIATHITYRAVR